MKAAIASSKSYVGSAIVTLVAYWILWLPGLIFNIMYLRDARKAQQVAGHALPGVGCLYILLIANLIWVVIACSIVTGTGILGIGASIR